MRISWKELPSRGALSKKVLDQETYLLSSAQLWGINSDEKAFDSTFFSVLDKAFGDAPILVDVSASILEECPICLKETYNWKNWTCSG